MNKQRSFYPMDNLKKAIRGFKENHGILRTCEVIKMGIHPRTLYRMRDRGLLERLSRGVYRLIEVEDFSAPDFVLVAKKIPNCVICLISALAYHEITTQIPHYVYVAIPQNAKKSTLEYPPIRYFWYSKKNFETGIEIIKIDGFPVRIYNKEKTLADCIKFRNKIGTDVMIEALKMYWVEGKTDVEKLYHYAKLNRVEKILQPIMETIVTE